MNYPSDDHRRPRKTICISSQVGCALGCTFCATGQQGFTRNLSSGEIISQIILCNSDSLSRNYLEWQFAEEFGLHNVRSLFVPEPAQG